LDLAPWSDEDSAFHGKKEFVASFVCTGVGALENMFLSFKTELAARTQMGIRSSGTDMFLLGTCVEPAMETFRTGDSCIRI
jgi:hypothetical protein